MDISVVISTWNNSALLKSTLEYFVNNLSTANIKWELVLVNNNCTDNTDKIAEEYLSKLPLHYVQEPRQGLSRARNAGLKASTGKLVIFGDDDIEPCKEWIKVYWEAYQKKPSGYYWGGPIESTYEKGDLGPELAAIAPGSVKGFDLGDKEIVVEKGIPFLGANWACPADILRSLNGFDIEKGLDPSCGKIRTSEETDLMMRLNEAGWQGCYIPNARIKHFVPLKKMTLKHIASRWEAWGYEKSDQYKQYLNHAQIPLWMLKEVSSKWLNYFWKRVVGHPWYKAYIEYREYTGILEGLRETGKVK